MITHQATPTDIQAYLNSIEIFKPAFIVYTSEMWIEYTYKEDFLKGFAQMVLTTKEDTVTAIRLNTISLKFETIKIVKV
jgi:hypothetical protein